MKSICAWITLALLGCGSPSIQKTPDNEPSANTDEDSADANSATNRNKKKLVKKKPDTATSTDPLSSDDPRQPHSPIAKDPAGDDHEPPSSGSQAPPANPPEANEPPDTPGDMDTSAGQSFFTKTVLPLFNNNCASCHADPRNNPPQRGPLTIFSYDAMLVLLNDGASAVNNRLARKVRNEDMHGGGNRCSAGATASPCKEIAEWWQIEHGITAGFDGRITSVSVSGDVVGYAVDTRDESLVVTARLFVDDQFSIESSASMPGSDGNYSGDHAFRIALPPAARDGKEHTLTLKVGDVVVGSPVKFTAYAPKDAGRAYFSNTVQPALDRACRRCHAIQYEVQYSALLTPAPNKGGTATNNSLINFAAGERHPGGNVCGGKNGNPCDLFQTWWTMEFGP